MNLLDCFSAAGLVDRAFCCRLTLALMHFLWQGAAIGAVSAAAAYALQKRSPNLRYGLHAALLGLMAACLPATYLLIDPSPRPTSVAPMPDAIAAPARRPVPSLLASDFRGSVAPDSVAAAPPPVPPPPSGSFSPEGGPPVVDLPEIAPAAPAGPVSLERFLESIAPYATAAYFAGLAAMMLRLITALWGGHRLRASSLPIGDPALLALAGRQAQRVGLKTAPLIAWCGRVAAPVVVGILHPAILLPASLASGLAPDQLAAIVAHELAHIRRYDLPVNLLQRAIEAVLFFHPATWYVSRQISRERENCCDDLVLGAGWRRIDYAQALLVIAERCAAGQAHAAALGASSRGPSEFKRRVLRVLTATQEPSVRLSRGGVVAVAAAMALAVALLVALHPGAVAQASPDVADDDLEGTAETVDEPATGDAGANAAEVAQPPANSSSVKDLAELIQRVRQNEALLQDLDATVRTDWKFSRAASGAYHPDELAGADARSARQPMTVEEVNRAVIQRGRLYFSGENTTLLASGDQVRGKRLSVFDGTRTVSIEEGNCVTVHQGRYEPAQLLPPHCWGIFTLQVNFPLSVYLGGTEAMKSHPKVRRSPVERGFAFEFNKVESQLLGEEAIDGLACVKVRVRRWYYTSDPPAIQDLWLAKDRNFHVARCRTASLAKDREVPNDESRVTQWRELAKGVWVPEAVEWKDLSPEKGGRPDWSRRLVVEKAVWKPNLPEGFFQLPEIPAGLPKFVIGTDGRLVESPFQPVPVQAAEKTTLQAILKRLAEEEKRYDQLDAVTATRYQELGRPEQSLSGAISQNTVRERSFAAGDRLYYRADQELKSASGGPATIVNRQAYDGRWLREETRIGLQGPDRKPEIHATLWLGGREEVRLLRAHNVLLRDVRCGPSIAGFLASGWFDKINQYPMTVEYVGDEKVGDLYCHKLKCELPLKGSMEPHNSLYLWLARDRNLLVVRREWRAPGWSEKLPTGISYVDDLREIRPGAWFPFHAAELACRRTSGDGLEANNLVLQWRKDIQAEKITPDPKVEEKLFSVLEVPEGTQVEVRNERWEPVGQFKQPQTGNLELSIEKFRAMERAAAANEEDQDDPKDATAPERKKRIDAALEVLRRNPSATQEERIEASLEILRNYHVFNTNAKKWALAIRVLIETGKPAVPRLISELDRTDRSANGGNTLRALGFVLRGIGDPRAVPSLIRALPRTLQPPRSDYGISIQFDPDLLAFMQRHDRSQTPFGKSFSFGRPINEILTALQKLTGQTGIVPGQKENPEFKDLHHIFLDGSAEEVRNRQTLFLRFAEQWADWWSKNWKAYVKDEAEAQLDQTRSALDQVAKAIPGAKQP